MACLQLIKFANTIPTNKTKIKRWRNLRNWTNSKRDKEGNDKFKRKSLFEKGTFKSSWERSSWNLLVCSRKTNLRQVSSIKGRQRQWCQNIKFCKNLDVCKELFDDKFLLKRHKIEPRKLKEWFKIKFLILTKKNFEKSDRVLAGWL
jgi:hypothetical protein